MSIVVFVHFSKTLGYAYDGIGQQPDKVPRLQVSTTTKTTARLVSKKRRRSCLCLPYILKCLKMELVSNWMFSD